MYEIIKLPLMHANDLKATITEVLHTSREYIKKGETLFLIEDTKEVGEVTADKAGYFLCCCEIYENKEVGEVLGYIFDSLEELDDYNQIKKENFTKEVSEVNATKKAMKLASEYGLDIGEIFRKYSKEKGWEGVIREKDVLEYYRIFEGRQGNNEQNHIFKYDRERVVIIGAGIGSEVVIDILLDDQDKWIVGLVDDYVRKMENYDFPLLECGINDFVTKIDKGAYDTVIASMGGNLKMIRLRDKIYTEYIKHGIEFTNAIAKDIEIRRGVKIGKGNIIGGSSYFGTLSEIGNNNSISYGVHIGHHNAIGDSNLFGPGVFTSGLCSFGSRCIISAGVSTINKIEVGDDVIIPVGYAVNHSLQSGKVIKNNIY